MNFNQLEAFVGLVKYRSFSKTAEALYISQPTISAQILKLEEELETTLIIRSTKGIELTESGKRFFFHARDIIYKRDAAIADMRQAAHITKGIVNIAASSIPVMCIIPSIISTLNRLYPAIFPVIHQCNSGEIAKKLMDLSCEVGVSGAYDSRDGCDYVPVFLDQLVVITPATKEYMELDDNIDIRSLLAYPFIEREPGSGTRLQYEKFFAAELIDPKRIHFVAQLTGTDSVLNAVKQGIGISIVSKLAAEKSALSGEIRIISIEHDALQRYIYMVSRKKHRFSPEAKAFVDILMSQSNLQEIDFSNPNESPRIIP